MSGRLAIEDPASAVAAGLCLSARAIGGETIRHPAACAWCAYPPAELSSMVAAFNAMAGHSERRGTYERHTARVFSELPAAEQQRRVAAAQGIESPQPVEE